MAREQMMLATAGALDLAPVPVDLETAGDSDLDASTPEHNHRRQLKRAVAALPASAIAEMQRRELIFAIRTAELPWLDGADHRLEYADRPTLERLAFLARRVCRRQLNGTLLAQSHRRSDPALRHDGRRLFGQPADAGEFANRDRTALGPLHWREKAR